jgi:hypothetical protein
MTHKSARREYLQALAEFERSCREFSEGMRQVLDPPAPRTENVEPLLQLGPRKPAKRTPRTDAGFQTGAPASGRR